MVLPKTVIDAVLAGNVTRARLPTNRWTAKSRDWLRSAHYHRDENQAIVKVTAGGGIRPLQITGYRTVQLDAATDEDARLEGYRDVQDLMTWFLRTYNGSWTDTPGWLVEFRVDNRERPRLLARQQGTRSTDGPEVAHAGQYVESTARSITGEPEAVDDLTLTRFAREAELRRLAYLGEKAAITELKRLGRQVREEGIRAVRRGVDISDPLMRIQRELDSIRESREAQ